MRKSLLPLLALLLATNPVVAAPRISIGSATTISKFNDLVYHHFALAFPLPPAAAWAPDAIVIGTGRFHRDDDSAAVYSIGPSWRWFLDSSHRWYVDAGIALAYLNQPWFRGGGDKRIDDFGMHFEFVSHAALGMHLDRAQRWSVQAGLMHVSNGGLDDTNPGADFIGIDVQFAY